MIESNLGIMCWNLNAHKTLDTRYQYFWTISVIQNIQTFNAQTLATGIVTVLGSKIALMQGSEFLQGELDSPKN